MAKGLLDLPFEILAQICQIWCSHCINATLGATGDTSIGSDSWHTKPASLVFDLAGDGQAGDERGQLTLARLSRTCKHLRAVAQPVLYHDFVTRERAGLFNFVRTLLQRPDLGPHVQRLNISVSGSGWIDGEDDVARFEHHAQHVDRLLSPPTLALLSQTCTQTERDASLLRHGWSASAELDSVVLQDLLLLLFPLVAHVKEAYLQLCPSPQQAIDSPDRPEQPVFRLPELKKLSFAPRPAITPAWHSQRDLLPAIISPKLTFLHLWYCTDPLTFTRGDEFVARYEGDRARHPSLPLQHLTVLRITGCRVSKVFLENLLDQVGPHLTTFTLFLGYMWATETAGGLLPDDVTPKQVIDSLLPWAQTLRAVRIGLSKAMPRMVKLRKTDLITSFGHFSRLRVLELDLGCVYIAELDGLLMFGVDTAQADWDLLVNLLPDSIHEFILNGPTHRVYDALEELSDRAASGSFSDLVRVRCDDGPVAHLEHLRDRFGIAGVNFSLRVPKYGFRQTLSGLF
ncbi:hypothetical protein CONLIGDRAFT_643476 [Coniochaeta ligniaria NRRL 30616]|uniref:Uncharacterized protein n=1 Tax=Coniochaeta ligniaria NRRL 30616 TaxID=1408157 RepID=A0A1J7JNP1_9PEZI|nr:hypothetical protein CONLIGDRAFT_643476 [Coniochaeta ligniaria NRRL 30616]